MTNARQVLKSILPPWLSYRLRILKALAVDAELRKLRVLCKEVGNNNQVALDIGTNFGIYAYIMSRYFKRVICFEPNPFCISYLRNVLPENCELIASAVSNREGLVQLNIPVVGSIAETTRGTIAVANILNGNNGFVKTFDVPMQKLDNLLLDIVDVPDGSISLIKIDVEGHEYEVLEGAELTLAKGAPIILAELESRHGTSISKTIELLKRLGYTADHQDSSANAGKVVGGNHVANNVNFVFRRNLE